MNLIIQQVLIKLLQVSQNIVDALNHKFIEIISIMGHLFDPLKAQALTVEAYDALTLQMNKSFQKVFEKFSDL